MELSSKIEYAIAALMELANAQKRGVSLSLNEIARKQSIPDGYLEKILSNLRLSGLVRSQRGARGGYTLTRQPSQITLLDVIFSLISDEQSLAKNGLNPAENIERQLLRDIKHEADQASREVLGSYTIEILCQKRDNSKQSKPMYYI